MTTTEVTETAPNGAEIMEQIIVKGDLSKLTPEERGQYYMTVCKSVGLNPLTKPFEYISLNGKLTLYALRGCTGVRPKAVKLDVLWETPKKRDRKFRVLESTRDERDYQAFLNRVVLMHSSIQAGIFGAAEQGNNWRCSEKYCGFFRTCRYARQPKSVAVPDLVPLLSESIERGKNGNETTERS